MYSTRDEGPLAGSPLSNYALNVAWRNAEEIGKPRVEQHGLARYSEPLMMVRE